MSKIKIEGALRYIVKALSPIIAAIAIALIVIFVVCGYHIVRKPTAAQLFGCEHTYVNAKGEDTGECE